MAVEVQFLHRVHPLSFIESERSEHTVVTSLIFVCIYIYIYSAGFHTEIFVGGGSESMKIQTTPTL